MQYALWKYPIHWLAYGFGLGRIIVAPGTFGSLLGIPLFWLMSGLSPLLYAGIVVVLFVPGIFICGQTAHDVGAIDPGFVVYDEIVGFLVAMFMMPFDWRWIAAGFVIYRGFDIIKPFPIGWIEDKLGLGSGIMVDDVIAGLYTLAILQFTRMLVERFASG
jgi:phosphatidylglycerophosphatase A